MVFANFYVTGELQSSKSYNYYPSWSKGEIFLRTKKRCKNPLKELKRIQGFVDFIHFLNGSRWIEMDMMDTNLSK